MSNFRDLKLEFSKVTFKSEEYLYIKEENPNLLNSEDKISWVYIQLKEFWMKKQGKNLHLGNSLGILYSLTGQYESILNQWISQIKSTIDFP
tara:strand:+ start:481 stop:756 length:276 start_codon:yes stop_codon:yes gene_type:complete